MNQKEIKSILFFSEDNQPSGGTGKEKKGQVSECNCVPIFMFLYILSVPTSYNQEMMSCLIRRQSLPVVGLVIDYR